ncbi:MAG: putative signal transducing protein [Gammaproteobacteria bacterium]
MKRVHIAPTLLDAQLAVDVLASVGITAHVFNANAAGATGEVPFMQAQPEIWVEDETQAARARETLSALRNAPARDEKTCAHCGETNPGNFLSCWQCGHALPD